MSSASSNQSFVRDGAGYEEVYPSGYKYPDDLSERSLSTSSPSSKNEDMEVAEPEEGSIDGEALRANYQIPDHIPICLPYKSEKCYYEGVDDVGVYEQVLKAGLRFPLNSLHRELLKYLGLFVNEISPNA